MLNSRAFCRALFMTDGGTMVSVIEYADPVVHCPGYLVYDATDCRLAAGGCRMQAGLTADTLKTLAGRMTLKQRVLGVNVDGAKCGIAYDPHGPHREEVLRRFVAFLAGELTTRFSMGCDMGTRFEELDRMAAALGIGSAKTAVRRAQRITEREFRARMDLLGTRVGLLTLGQRRAGQALAHSALAATAHTGRRDSQVSVALQGFGNLGRAAALALLEAGVRITVVADEYGCAVDPRGLDIARMLTLDQSRPVQSLLAEPMRLPREALLELPADVLVLAAGEDAVTASQAAVLPVPIVAVGANCGLSATAERLLLDRGVVVVPDFIGGIGGSASMEALFGPRATPTAPEVLDTIGAMMRELVGDILCGARDRRVSPRQVAADIAASAIVSPGDKPYGASPYRPTRPTPRGGRGRSVRTPQKSERRPS
ncbi:Glu/Leu/Phe/Val dehydrogenase dimerization domain-containing protein [Streptomyces sp. TLI_146]|uniref:Glu/Leu/Phe/Val dehydrogenase dimerization domain-containing protein n=1 Tax=Streptomyces sp. TLI_146 TaxID=1938858 RepID=UPI000CBDA3EB|nr:Glu/Leu/Phe/Val dehydrogenase dimerization domain-containing protein [Streptomyces sp. TLI_146]PKV89024.1 glutamate dehydrogenase (NAD(P)+) [Streptomyces sp. TLI_146]